MSFVRNLFKSEQSQQIDAFIQKFKALDSVLLKEFIPTILDYEDEPKIGDVVLYILKKANWDYERLSDRKKFYLQKCNVARFVVPSLLFAGDRRPRITPGGAGSDAESDSDKDVPQIPVERVMRAVCLFANHLTELEIGDINGWGCERYLEGAFEMTHSRSAEQIKAYKSEVEKVCEVITRLKKLKRLHVYGYRLNNEMTARIIASCQSLEDLKLTRAGYITDVTLKKLSEVPYLTKLHISGDHPQFTGEGLNCPKLTELFLGRALSHRNQIFTEFPLESLITRHPKLRQLNIDGFRLNPRQVDLFKELPDLEYLSIGDYERIPELAKAVAALPVAKYVYYFIWGEFD